MRRAAKRDMNEGPIVEALRAAGATVTFLSAAGCPDLLCGFRGRTWLLEVKAPLGPKGGIGDGRLTEEQEAWWSTWRGSPPLIVRDAMAALVAIGAVENKAPVQGERSKGR